MFNPFFTCRELPFTAITERRPEATWEPAVDVYRYAGGWVLKFELAGVRQEDIRVQFDTHGVTVSGKRVDRRLYDFQQAHLMEIAYSRFERAVVLPEPIDNVQFHIEFQDGMLYIFVSQSSSSQSR